jgi:hypothetical protein
MSHQPSHSTAAAAPVPRPRKSSLTVWWMALAIGGISGSLIALVRLFDLPETAGEVLIGATLAVPILAIGHLAVVLPDRWLRRTAMTVLVGGLLAAVFAGAADTYIIFYRPSADTSYCSHSGLPALLLLFVCTLFPAAALRRLARGR